MRQNPELLGKGPGYMLYAVLDFVVDQYFPIVGELEDELEAIEEGIFRSRPDRDAVENAYDLKSKMMRVRRAVLPVVQICNDLPNHRSLISEEIRPYFRDVSDHALQHPRSGGLGAGDGGHRAHGEPDAASP